MAPSPGGIPPPRPAAIGVAASLVSNVAVHWKSKPQLDDTLDVRGGRAVPGDELGSEAVVA